MLTDAKMNSKFSLLFRVILATKWPLLCVNQAPMPRFKIWTLLIFLWPTAVSGAELGPVRRLGNGEVLRGRFTEEHPVKGITKPLRSEGHFVVAPRHGLIWAIEKPLPVTFVFTDSGMVQTIGDLPLLQQSSQKMPFLGQVTGLLTAALGGDWKTLEPDFAVSHSGNAKRWRVKIVPRPSCPMALPFRAINASGKTFVEHADVLRPDGLSDTFVFTEHNITSAPLTNTESKALSLLPM
jgi:hypothetical protein